MTRTVDSLASAEVRAVPLYSPDGVVCSIDLSDNTNLWGSPPAALAAMRNLLESPVSRYPSLYGGALGDAMRSYLRLSGAAHVTVATGCGSDDIIDSTIRAFATRGDTIAFASPTFTMIPTFARLNGLIPIGVPFVDGFEIDAQRLVDCNARITYLCSPNNPTGTVISRAAVEFIVKHARGIVLLDEAYAEFAAETFVDLVERNERLIVTRTFSKAFGLAGLRIGCGIAHREVIGFINRARGPYKVSLLAEQAAISALASEPGALPWVQQQADRVIVNRQRFECELRRAGFTPVSSSANFVLLPLARASLTAERLQTQGVQVRAFSELPLSIAAFAATDGTALRIGVGPWEMMQTCLDRLVAVTS